MAFSGVFVFGHSLVDGGNALKLANKYASLPLTKMPEGAPTAAKGYFEGRFSDGYTFADLIANKAIGTVTKPIFPYGFEDPWIGIPISPFRNDPQGNNLNFAYGGAQIRQGSEVVPDFDGQTDAFRNAVDGRADPGALYLVSIGGNDVRALAPADRIPVAAAEAHTKLERAADTMLLELIQLVQIGARNFLISGIADVGTIPKYDVDGNLTLDASEQLRASAATNYSAFLDALIRNEVVPALQSRGANVVYVPNAEYLDAAGQRIPGTFGLTLPTIAALNGLTAQQLSANLLAYQDLLFFDDVHPNGQLNALVGSYLHAQLTGTAWIEKLPLAGADVDHAQGGMIAAAGEVDTIPIALARKSTYTFEMLGISSFGTAGSLGDTSLRLFDASGSFVAADDDSGVGFDARLGFTTGASGTYFLELSAPGSLTGAYALHAAVAGAASGRGDVYRLADASTLVLEAVGGLGTDVVIASISYALPDSAEIEFLKSGTLIAGAAIDLTGNGFAQAIVGNSGANTLDGKGGSDELWGRGGPDTFLFSSVLDGSVDRIKDFDARRDIIALDDAIFGGIPGPLPAERFSVGPTASTLADLIIFDPLTKILYYDPDGSGAHPSLPFATLEGRDLNISASDFLIV